MRQIIGEALRSERFAAAANATLNDLLVEMDDLRRVSTGHACLHHRACVRCIARMSSRGWWGHVQIHRIRQRVVVDLLNVAVTASYVLPLLGAGAAVTGTDALGRTPFHVAATHCAYLYLYCICVLCYYAASW
jgi:hypothetical protein